VGGFHDLASSIRPGDVILLQYGSMDTPALIFHQVARWGLENGYAVVVNDVLNSLYIYKQHLRLFGVDTAFMDEIYSIKWGGKLYVGNVVRTVNIGSPAVEVMGEYKSSIEDIMRRTGGRILVIFTGAERVFIPYYQLVEDILVILNGMLPHLGDERMVSFYLLNTDVAKGISSLVSLAFQGVATIVVRCRTDNRTGEVAYEVTKRIGP